VDDRVPQDPAAIARAITPDYVGNVIWRVTGAG
jgi:hypothetical protein